MASETPMYICGLVSHKKKYLLIKFILAYNA